VLTYFQELLPRLDGTQTRSLLPPMPEDELQRLAVVMREAGLLVS
jgi:hypothetical protein